MAACEPEGHADPVTVAGPTHSSTAAVPPNVKDVPAIPEVQTALPDAPQQAAPRKARRTSKRAVPHEADLDLQAPIELLGEPTNELLGAPLAD